ncbi:hypothetical protein [Methanosarcina sp.]|uniref:hypothetical protein n=1 Tax=Methanosarcina sp. TaxID=2213 RepID=UPI003BB6C79E
MGTVLYKDYTAFGSPVGVSWGTVYSWTLLKTVEDFSSDMTTGIEIQNGSSLPASESLIHNQFFFCPVPLSERTIFDGPAYGNVGIKLWNCTDDNPVYLKKVYINIVKVSNTGVETSLIGSDLLIWSGNMVLGGGTYPNTPVTNLQVIPFWVPLDWQEVTQYYRIGLRVKVYGYAQTNYGASQYNKIYIAIDSTKKQTFMSLPIALASD